MRRPLEKEVQAAVVQLFRTVGLEVWSSSQYRPSQVSEGIPDLWVMHRGGYGAFYFEVKRPSERDPSRPEPLRLEQALFRQYCERNRISYFWGGFAEAEHALTTLGLGHYGGPPSRPTFTLHVRAGEIGAMQPTWLPPLRAVVAGQRQAARRRATTTKGRPR